MMNNRRPCNSISQGKEPPLKSLSTRSGRARQAVSQLHSRSPVTQVPRPTVKEVTGSHSEQIIQQVKNAFAVEAELCQLPRPHLGIESIRVLASETDEVLFLEVPVSKKLTCYYSARNLGWRTGWSIHELDLEMSGVLAVAFRRSKVESKQKEKSEGDEPGSKVEIESATLTQLYMDKHALVRRNEELDSKLKAATENNDFIPQLFLFLIKGFFAFVLLVFIGPFVIPIVGIFIFSFLGVPLAFFLVEMVSLKIHGKQ